MKSIYKDFIGIYENAFPKEYCQYLIDIGKKNIAKAKVRESNPFYNEDLNSLTTNNNSLFISSFVILPSLKLS